MIAAVHQGSRFRDLSEPCRRLLRLMQDVNFGQIAFRMRLGEPDPAGPWRILRTVKLASGENGARPEAGSADFELRKEHAALLRQLARIDDDTQVTVEVRHGLPLLVKIEHEQLAV